MDTITRTDIAEVKEEVARHYLREARFDLSLAAFDNADSIRETDHLGDAGVNLNEHVRRTRAAVSMAGTQEVEICLNKDRFNRDTRFVELP